MTGMRRIGVPALCVALQLGATSLGCNRDYWVNGSELTQAMQLQAVQPPNAVAVRAYRVSEAQLVATGARAGAPPEYLRVSTLRPNRSLPPLGAQLPVLAPNKRGKRIGGAVLVGFGGTLVLGGLGLIAWGISIGDRDKVGSGIVAGAGGLPMGVGLPLLIAGGVTLGRGMGPDDVVPPGQPGVAYVSDAASPPPPPPPAQ